MSWFEYWSRGNNLSSLTQACVTKQINTIRNSFTYFWLMHNLLKVGWTLLASSFLKQLEFHTVFKQLSIFTCRLCSYFSSLSLRKMSRSIDVRSSFQSSFKIFFISIFIPCLKADFLFWSGLFYHKTLWTVKFSVNKYSLKYRDSVMRSPVNDPLMINWD